MRSQEATRTRAEARDQAVRGWEVEESGRDGEEFVERGAEEKRTVGWREKRGGGGQIWPVQH